MARRVRPLQAGELGQAIPAGRARSVLDARHPIFAPLDVDRTQASRSHELRSSSSSAPRSRTDLPAAGLHVAVIQRNTTANAAALDYAHPRDSTIIEPPEASISDIPERLTHESAGRARKSLAAHQRLDPAHTPNDPLSCARRHAAITAPKPDRTTIASTRRVITPLKRTPLRALPPDSRHGQESQDCTLATQSSTQYDVELWVVIVSCAAGIAIWKPLWEGDVLLPDISASKATD